MPQPGFYEALRVHFTRAIPHARACGMEAEVIDGSQATLMLPYREAWLADAEKGWIHPSMVTTLIDTACGLALMAAAGQFERIATLDLRVDYLRPAMAPKAVRCRAECFRKTDTIAFVRSIAWQDDPNEPCAVSQAAFMRMPLKMPQP